MGTIGYFDAWGRWFSGLEVDPQLSMGFLTILWWGRLGKIAAFLGGLTVILDLLGVERLHQIAKGRQKWESRVEAGIGWLAGSVVGLTVAISAESVFRGATAWAGVLAGVAAGIISSIFSRISVGVIRRVTKALVDRLANTLAKPNPAYGIRIAATAMIVAGFHFDLLAS
jgi:hypothetical protein